MPHTIFRCIQSNMTDEPPPIFVARRLSEDRWLVVAPHQDELCGEAISSRIFPAAVLATQHWPEAKLLPGKKQKRPPALVSTDGQSGAEELERRQTKMPLCVDLDGAAQCNTGNRECHENSFGSAKHLIFLSVERAIVIGDLKRT